MVTWSDRLHDALGKRTADKLERELGIRTVGELLSIYPRRYYRHGELTDLASLRPGEHATVVARVRSVKQFAGPRGGRQNPRSSHRVEVVVTDEHADLLLTFFGRRNQGHRLRPGSLLMVSGQINTFRNRLQLVHPQIAALDGLDGTAADAVAREFADRIIAVYPATKALSTDVIQRCVGTVLDVLHPIADPLPATIRDDHGLLDLDAAISAIHRPVELSDADQARRRLAFDEAFTIQLALARRRAFASFLRSPARPRRPDGLLDAFDRQSALTLTAGQRDIGESLSDRLSGTVPMHVLLQGDVGTGKTLVALRAMLQVVDTGGQAVLLAPTEVLAQQHAATLRALLGPLAEGGLLGGADHGTRVALLTGSLSAAERRAALLDITTGQAGIVVGTHALIESSVEYADLGLIVVDEQHRFGVEQRAALLERQPGERPHLLVMTATPIPRSVAMTVFGDLDVVTLTERPHGAPRIVSHVVSEPVNPSHVDRAWQRAVEEVQAGRQVFVVCSRIGADDEDDPALLDPEQGRIFSVEETAAELSAGVMADVRVGVLHGAMRPDDKDLVMRRFGAGPTAADGLDVLVATTVIEVGVDVPTAGLMIILNAERFGVSQLHQLRGRVGRDGRKALCLFVTATAPGHPAHERLRALAATLDGFEVARIDLTQRREGDVLGTAQSGRASSLRLLSVLRDEELIALARDDARRLVQADPDLRELPLLAAAVAALEVEERADYLDKS